MWWVGESAMLKRTNAETHECSDATQGRRWTVTRATEQDFSLASLRFCVVAFRPAASALRLVTRRMRAALLMAPALVCLVAVGAHAEPAAQFDGAPRLTEGRATGYFVWREGLVWKVRWTTDGREHHFSGTVAVEGGTLTSMARVDDAEERRTVRRARGSRAQRNTRNRVRRAGQPGDGPDGDDEVTRASDGQIRFDVLSREPLDGFDFAMTATTERIRFAFEPAGQGSNVAVVFGLRNLRATVNPLVAILR